MNEKMRINKYLSSAGVCSRRAADKLIADGKVYIDGVCAKMQELEDEFKCNYNALRCPDVDGDSYTDMISFEKAEGKIAQQRSYVGKLMTRAMAALK